MILSGLIVFGFVAFQVTAQDSSVVPAWFNNEVLFCYKYWADGDGGQCNSGGLGWTGETCARPNTQTAEYRDDTDSRSGGCQMQWKLIAPYRGDGLALAVAKLCYRYRSDGDAGQCGSHRPTETTCVNINEYTPAYRDDTDGRSGGCQMSWMIQTPAGVPIPAWMSRLGLCLTWRQDGDAQCSGPVSPICAGLNQWTGEYRDDTDNRSGGCRMAWSINH